MNHCTRLALILLVCALSPACATREAKPVAFADYDRETSFAGYRSYAWMKANPLFVATIQPVNPNLEATLMSETAALLAAKGIRRVEKPEDADFVVSFTVGSRDNLQVNNYPGRYRLGRVGSAYPESSEVREVTTGAIAIEVFNQETGTRTWTGWATTGLTMDVRADSAPVVKEMVQLILEQFPPPS